MRKLPSKDEVTLSSSDHYMLYEGIFNTTDAKSTMLVLSGVIEYLFYPETVILLKVSER